MKLFLFQAVLNTLWLHCFSGVLLIIFNLRMLFLCQSLLYSYNFHFLLWWEKQPLECRHRAIATLCKTPSRWRHTARSFQKKIEKDFIFLQQTLTFRRKQNIHKRGKLNEEFAAGGPRDTAFPDQESRAKIFHRRFSPRAFVLPGFLSGTSRNFSSRKA